MLSLPRTTLALCIGICTVLSCTKQNKQSATLPEPAQSPVDGIAGSYRGSMHIYNYTVHYSDYANPQITDSTYPLTITIDKVAADSFSVSGITFSQWEYVHYTSTSHICFIPTNVYCSLAPWGQTDTLIIGTVSDSMHFRSRYSKPGGATSESRNQTFTGKKL